MTSERSVRASRLVIGLVLITIGGLFLLDRLMVVDAGSWSRYWPVILIVMGLGHWVAPERRRGGAWLTFIGVVMLLHTLGVFRLHDSWPLFLVAAGLGWIWSGWRGEACCGSEESRHDR